MAAPVSSDGRHSTQSGHAPELVEHALIVAIMAGLLALMAGRNLLTRQKDAGLCYNLWGSQTDHDWQLKSQLILVRLPNKDMAWQRCRR